MSDEELVDGTDPDLEEEEDSDREKRGRGIIAIIIAVLVVIIVLLLLRDCGAGDSGTPSAGKKTIESVDGMEPTKALVSVWVSDATTLEAALSAAGVSASDQIDLGDGRWVISVPKGSEDAAVKKLGAAPNVYDAGLVYERADD